MASWLAFLCLAAITARCWPINAERKVEDGTYLVRLLFIRHGFSCANVPWEACTMNSSKLTKDGMGAETYAATLDKLDKLLQPEQPDSMVGMDKDWGIKPRGWPIPGRSKTSNGKSDDCLVKALNATLVDDQYDELGNLVAIRQLVRDPHLTACDQYKAQMAARVLAGWLGQHQVELDMVGSSSMRRAIETSEMVYVDSPAKSSTRRIRLVTVLPYINEKNVGTPFQPENFPYPGDVQEKSMRDLLGSMSGVDVALTSGTDKRSYPRRDQQWDKFKAVLALDLLPELIVARGEGKPVGPWTPNAPLAAALEAGRAEGKPKFPVQSNWPQIRDAPIKEVSAGDLNYVWKEPTLESAYTELKEAGAEEFTLGIGSHGNFLGMYCMQGEDHPHNLAVLQKLIVVRVNSEGGKSSFEVAEVAGKCRTILESPAAPEPGTLSKSDLGDACTKNAPFDVSLFVDTQPEPEDGKLTDCKAKAKEFRLTADAEAEGKHLQEKFASNILRRGPALLSASVSGAAVGWSALLITAAVLGGAGVVWRARHLDQFSLLPPGALAEPFSSRPSQVSSTDSPE